MKQNFEQDKSVSYSLLVSRFVIPWGIEDSKRIHAEVETSDGVCVELIPEEDFVVDCEDNFLTLKNTDVEGILRIYDGEKQELKYSIDPNIRSPHNLVRDGDLSPMYLRLENLEKHTDSIETGAKNLTEVVSTLCQRVDNVDIIQMDRDVTALASKSLEADKTTGKLKADVGTLQEDHGKVKADVTALASKSLETIKHVESLNAENNTLKTQLKDLEDRIKALEPLKESFDSSGDLILRVTEQNKTPGISFKGQDGKDIAYMFVRGGDLLIGRDDGAGKLSPCIKLTPDGFKVDGRSVQEHIRGEKDPRYGELIHSELVTKVGDIYNGSQIWHWIYGEGITPPLTPEERLKKWRVIRNHAGTGKHCRGAFIEHND